MKSNPVKRDIPAVGGMELQQPGMQDVFALRGRKVPKYQQLSAILGVPVEWRSKGGVGFYLDHGGQIVSLGYSFEEALLTAQQLGIGNWSPGEVKTMAKESDLLKMGAVPGTVAYQQAMSLNPWPVGGRLVNSPPPRSEQADFFRRLSAVEPMVRQAVALARDPAVIALARRKRRTDLLEYLDAVPYAIEQWKIWAFQELRAGNVRGALAELEQIESVVEEIISEVAYLRESNPFGGRLVNSPPAPSELEQTARSYEWENTDLYAEFRDLSNYPELPYGERIYLRWITNEIEDLIEKAEKLREKGDYLSAIAIHEHVFDLFTGGPSRVNERDIERLHVDPTYMQFVDQYTEAIESVENTESLLNQFAGFVGTNQGLFYDIQGHIDAIDRFKLTNTEIQRLMHQGQIDLARITALSLREEIFSAMDRAKKDMQSARGKIQRGWISEAEEALFNPKKKTLPSFVK